MTRGYGVADLGGPFRVTNNKYSGSVLTKRLGQGSEGLVPNGHHHAIEQANLTLLSKMLGESEFALETYDRGSGMDGDRQ